MQRAAPLAVRTGHLTRRAPGAWLAAATLAGGVPARAQETPGTDRPSLPRCEEVLVLPPLGQYARSAVFSDPVLAELARDPTWTPAEGLTLTSAEGRSASWQSASLDAEGALRGEARGNGWIFTRWRHERDEVLLLEAPGAGVVYAGGEPRMGDLYALGTVRTAVAVREGVNELWLRAGRGRPRMAWSRPPAAACIASFDRTLPSLLVGEAGPFLAGVVVTNASTSWARGLSIAAQVGGAAPLVTALPALAPLESRKVAIELRPPPALDGERAPLVLELRADEGATLHSDAFELDVLRRSGRHDRTFRSRIDDSAQYYSVVPPSAASGLEAPALVLTLHGASVEARGQAASYAPKEWCYFVAPTNRRPYGFDWEDWGRRDALEVLELALGGALRDDAGRSVQFDVARVHLTGHSMGGHGTWQIGARYAERFASIAPSAGWSDFWSYAGGDAEAPADPLGALLHRASNGSRTLLWSSNYAKHGVYVLHGDADDNVPVREARRMREALGKFHPDFAYFEQRGAGHWWGAECVDWPPLIEFLRRRRAPSRRSATEVTIQLVDLDAERSSGFATLIAQRRPLLPSELHARVTPKENRVEVRTTNVEAFSLSVLDEGRSAGGPRWSEWRADEPGLAVVDGSELRLPPADEARGGWTLRRVDAAWRLASEDAGAQGVVRPRVCGPFKEAFDRRFVLVYGTAGDAEENAWALAKARFDADQFRYRGNASPLLIADSELVAVLDDAAHDLHTRNLVLYGNAKTNAAWSAVVRADALEVQPSRLRVGRHEFEGADLALLAVRPHARRPGLLVGLVGGTGVLGMRATNHAPYFVSGAGFPDWWVARASFLSTGLAAHLGAGFFRTDGSVDDEDDTVVRRGSEPR